MHLYINSAYACVSIEYHSSSHQYCQIPSLIKHASLSPSQALGGVLIGVGAWLEVQEQTIVDVVNNQVFLVGPYLLIAAGCCIVIVALIGMFGAFCDSKVNRFLLVLVSPVMCNGLQSVYE